MRPTAPTVVLNNGVEMPQLGLGVFKIPEDEVRAAVETALHEGYRLVDTAALYGNEVGVGEALRASGLRRDDVFVTSKVWNTDQGYDRTLRAFDASMDRLGLEVLDLYLIHWPVPRRDLYLDTWRAMRQLYLEGRIRAIGVSNFQPDHLLRLAEESDVVPAVNQVELHPRLQQSELRALHGRLGIRTEAWAPLARGGPLLHEPVLESLARKHERTPAQVVLRWHVEVGNIVIPKSVTPERIRENADIFDFTLDRTDMRAIADLEVRRRTGPHPDRMD